MKWLIVGAFVFTESKKSWKEGKEEDGNKDTENERNTKREREKLTPAQVRMRSEPNQGYSRVRQE